MQGIKTSCTAFKIIWRQVNPYFMKDSRLPVQNQETMDGKEL